MLFHSKQPTGAAAARRPYAWLAAFVVVSVASGATADLPGWSLAWEDDFNSFDSSKWIKATSTDPTNNSRHAYLPEQVDVNNGQLVITAENQSYSGLPYRSGQVFSTSEQRLGRWEVRANLPTSQGMWPAIWLLPNVSKHPWPGGGEIDIMENRGSERTTTSSAFHYGSNSPYVHDFVYSEQQTAVGAGLADYHNGFHTYAVDWTDRYIRFYVDGVHHYTVHDEDVGGFLSQKTAPMQLVINNAIGGDFLADPDGSTQWPQTMEIDWVRVYEHDPDSFNATFTNGGFEQNGGSLSGWSVFGNELANNPNVRAAGEAAAEGDSALKLFGPFQGGGAYSGVSQGITVVGGQHLEASLRALVRSNDSIAGSDNSALLKIEFYSEFGAKYGGDTMLGEQALTIADGGVAEDVWVDHTLAVAVPNDAVEARVVVLFHQPTDAGGAVHVDDIAFAVNAEPNGLGDYNGDGVVNAADYVVYRDEDAMADPPLDADGDRDGEITERDYSVWNQRYGQVDPPVAVIPEPSGAAAFVLLTLIRCAVGGR